MPASTVASWFRRCKHTISSWLGREARFDLSSPNWPSGCKSHMHGGPHIRALWIPSLLGTGVVSPHMLLEWPSIAAAACRPLGAAHVLPLGNGEALDRRRLPRVRTQGSRQRPCAQQVVALARLAD